MGQYDHVMIYIGILQCEYKWLATVKYCRLYNLLHIRVCTRMKELK